MVNSNDLMQRLIDDEDLENAKPQEKDLNQRQNKIRYNADQYGSFAANENRDVEDENELNESADGVDRSHNLRESSQ